MRSFCVVPIVLSSFFWSWFFGALGVGLKFGFGALKRRNSNSCSSSSSPCSPSFVSGFSDSVCFVCSGLFVVPVV